jgi:secreted PhoX family phosphatase
MSDDSNSSTNPHFDTVLQARLSRRNILRGGMATAGTALFGAIGLSGCGGNDEAPVVTAPAGPVAVPEVLLGFNAVAKSLADTVVVPAGYSATVLYALGDPLAAGVPAYKNDGTDTDFDKRAGDHHDGMEFFSLDANGGASISANDRGLLAMNHEATTDEKLSSFFLHANGGTMTLPRPAAEIDKEVAVHGLSVVEVRRTGSRWEYQPASNFNRRVTPLTEVDIHGPARGSSHMVTRFSTTGTRARDAEQLRHRQDTLEQFRLRRRELERLLPARQRRRRGARQRQVGGLAQALWPPARIGHPPRLGKRRRR